MSLSFGLLQFFGVCRHPQTYRERRELHGVQVLHLVCEDCGYAVPALQRTAEEHQRAVQAGAPRPAEVRRLPAGIVSLGKRRRSNRAASGSTETRRVSLATSDGVSVAGSSRIGQSGPEQDDQGPYSRKVM
jgi:hypothetical protein